MDLRRLLPLFLASFPLVSLADPTAPKSNSPDAQVAPANVWLADSFGAVGDGRTLNTATLQNAIDAAHAAGGGVVQFGPGRYLTGTLELRSHVTLHLVRETTILGSPRIADYRRANWPALILAINQEHVAITGEGVIDGQGKLLAEDSLRIYASGNHVDFFPGIKPGELVFTGIGTDKQPWIDPHAMQAAGTLAKKVAPRDREDVATWRVDEMVRPQLIEFWHCRNVRVTGVTLKNAANWVQTYRECDDVFISRIRVDSVTYWNNDGLDIVNSRRVRIEDCDINAADDGICLKSDPSETGRLCEDITVLRCRVRSSASAFKLGTASHHGFRRIRVEDLEVFDTYRSAIAIETVDGGLIDDIKVTRVRATNTGNAIFLRLGQRNRDKPPGTLRNVEISDVHVQTPSAKPDAGYEHSGPPIKVAANLIPSSISGLPDRPVENVVLRDIHLTYGGGAKREIAEIPLDNLAAVPEKRENYPEFSMFGELPAWGFYLRHAHGIKFENVTLRLTSPDFRPAIVADNVEDLTVNHLTLGDQGGEPAVMLNNIRRDSWSHVSWPSGAKETIRSR